MIADIKAAPERVLLRAARVFRATGDPAIHDGVVAIMGEKIEFVSSARELGSSLGDSVVLDTPNGTILPGLVDAHAHLTLPADGRPYEEMTDDPDELLSLIAVRNMQIHMQSGVTTIRDNGGRNRVTFSVREALNRGYFIGPRLLLAGRPLTSRSGHLWWCNGEANGADEIRAAVRNLVAQGADHIKIMASGGSTIGTDPSRPSYDADEIRVAVDTAHGLGRLTAAHCRARQSIANAIEAGVDCIEHCQFIVPCPPIQFGPGVSRPWRFEYDQQLAERLIASGAYVSFTLQAAGHEKILDHEELEKLSPEMAAQNRLIQAYHEGQLEMFSRLLADGLGPKMVVSTDAGPFTTPFGRIVEGVEFAVAGGMSTTTAIEAITRTAAGACGVLTEVGTIEAGKTADLLVVDKDPLDDVRQLAHVAAVYVRGRQISLRPDDSVANPEPKIRNAAKDS